MSRRPKPHARRSALAGRAAAIGTALAGTVIARLPRRAPATPAAGSGAGAGAAGRIVVPPSAGGAFSSAFSPAFTI